MTTRSQRKKDNELETDNFTSSPPAPDSNQERINELINNAFENGKAHGKKETLEAIYAFLKDKSISNFMDNKDDIAKIIRDLSNDVKNAIS